MAELPASEVEQLVRERLHHRQHTAARAAKLAAMPRPSLAIVERAAWCGQCGRPLAEGAEAAHGPAGTLLHTGCWSHGGRAVGGGW